MTSRRIVYVPGLLPKPEPDVHHDALWRCFINALEHHDPEVAGQIDRDTFELVAWTYGFYGRHRDFSIDAQAVEDCVSRTAASERDRREARTLKRRLDGVIRRLSDHAPFVIPHLAGERVRLHLADLARYRHDVDGAASRVRATLSRTLLEGPADQRVLLIGHSMGSVIAWDTLWQLSREQGHTFRVDLYLTMGSPLGQRFVQRDLRGWQRHGLERYPDNIRRWHNLTAVGALTAAYPRLAPRFRGMRALLERQSDEIIDNWFRLDGELNPHAEYGYLANAATAKAVAAWWREG